MWLDGVHVRHFGMLSVGGTLVAAKLLWLVELAGRLPSQLGQVVVPLLAKSPGPGFRPMGIFPSLYRVLMKLRRPLCTLWEEQHDRSYYAMSKGRRVSDPVWQQSVLAEAAVGGGTVACSVLGFGEVLRSY